MRIKGLGGKMCRLKQRSVSFWVLVRASSLLSKLPNLLKINGASK